MSYYDTELGSFLNIFYSANIALETYFTNWLFHGEADRMIYASTDYAFRRRIELKAQNPADTDNYNTLDFPFMNYKGKIIDTTDRPWWNYTVKTNGLFIPEIGVKVRATPVTFEYDSTIYCHRDDELQYLTAELMWENSDETQLEKVVDYSIDIGGQTIVLPGVLEFDINQDTLYNENDWLERNKIHTIDVNFTLQTFLLKTNSPYDETTNPNGNFIITNEVCLEFQVLHPETEGLASEELYTYINDYYS